MIDFHVHLGSMYREEYPQRVPLSVHQLIDRMNREGIELSVLLSLESPEGGWGYLLTEQVIAARDQYPERLVAFLAADPRYPKATQQIDYFVKYHDCRGFGEHVNGLAFDDPLNRAIYAKCDEHGLPLVFELNTHYCFDEIGFPALEQCLKDYPNVTFVGHGPGWWAGISGDYDGRGGYPPGPIAPGGAVDRLMERYGNLYADLSAGSGYNAMTRDPDFTPGFLQRHWRKLLFGTDYLAPGEPLPHIRWFRSLDLEPAMKEAMARGNARRLLRLED